MNVNDASGYNSNIPDQNPAPQSNPEDANGLSNLFMTLLVAQIANQNPLNPTDGTEYVNQLAQLAQTQSLENVAELTKTNSILMDNLQTLSTANLVGQKVMVETDKIEVKDGQEVEGRLTLKHAAGVVTVYLKDENGTQYKVELGKQEAGQVKFNTKDLDLPDGKYTLSVVTDTGESDVRTEMAGIVNNVRIPLDGGVTLLNITGLGDIPYNQIRQFGESKKDGTDTNKLI